MKYIRDTFHLAAGFFLGVAFAFGYVSLFQILVSGNPPGAYQCELKL